MRFNNKGFAVSSIMYLILVMCIILITVTLSILGNRKLILDKKKNEIVNKLSNDNSSSKIICEGVTEETVTKNGETLVGNIPTGEYKAGDEYICNVDRVNKYHFFVVSSDGDNINLIMDTNLKGEYQCLSFLGEPSDGVCTEYGIPDLLTEWISNEDYKALGGTNSYPDGSKGPLTALKSLKEATSGWKNIPNFSYTLTSYNSSYGPIEVENVKARMLSYTEASSLCGEYGYNCPSYLGINTGVYDGYWLSDVEGTFSNAFGIDGGISSPSIDSDAPYCVYCLFKIRPVITLKKDNIS